MKHFEENQRVKVNAIGHPLLGQTGTVWRVHMRDNDAWIDMDGDLPDELRSFFGEDDERRNLIELSPKDCEPIDP